MQPTTILDGAAKLYYGQDALLTLQSLESNSVQTICTSPPYYNLRDYGRDGQIGTERTPEDYISTLVGLFREARRVLRDDGTLWLNIGDSYLRKNLLGIPWRVALALQQDGWLLRNDIIWNKPNPMPSSVSDRCTVAHEYIFLLTPGPKYYYNPDAIREPLAEATVKDKRFGMKHDGPRERYGGQASCPSSFAGANPLGANRRTVWTVKPNYYQGAHCAVFPEQIPERCILASTRKGDCVLDPFSGSGTTGKMAIKHSRSYVGLDLNSDYLDLALRRVDPYQTDTPSQEESDGQISLFTGVDG